jgi:hypothetical protein
VRIHRPAAILAFSTLALGASVCSPAFGQQAVEKEPNNSAAQANPLALDGRIEGFAGELLAAFEQALKLAAGAYTIRVLLSPHLNGRFRR